MEMPRPNRVRLSSASGLEVKGLKRLKDFFRVVAVVVVVAVDFLLTLDKVRRGVNSGDGGNGGGGKGNEAAGFGGLFAGCCCDGFS